MESAVRRPQRIYNAHSRKRLAWSRCISRTSAPLDGKAKPENSKDITMRQIIEFLIRVVLFAVILYLLWWASYAHLSNSINLAIIWGAILLTFPVVWFGRKILDLDKSKNHVAWITTFVHSALVFTFGIPIARALTTHQDWSGWSLPIPAEIGLMLVIVTSGVTLLTVITLAVKGLGAPFFIVLSKKLAVDWLYTRTRNPMVLSVLALGLSLGVWFQSILFVLWILVLFTPALLFFVKMYEERELEFRFGYSYLEYKSKTPMLFPRKPRD